MLNRLVQISTSKDAPQHGETPHVVEASESGEGMNPYRGFDSHGVERVAIPRTTPEVDDKTLLHYTAPVAQPDPIPVRIVNEGGREINTFEPGVEYATNVQRSIIGANPDRKKVTIVNNGAVTVWLGKNNNVGVGNGYPLAAGASVTWEIHAAVWAVSNDGTQQQLAIVQFFSIPLDAAHAIRPGS